MIISAHRRTRSPILRLALVLASVAAPDRLHAQSAVPLTFNADVQVSKLHPRVTQVGFGCNAPLPVGLPASSITGGPPTTRTPYARGGPVPVTNRAFSGVISVTVNIPADILAIPANRTLNFTCMLNLYEGAGYRDAVASAAQPQPITTQNLEVVGVGSVVTWTQSVTFK